MIPFTDADGLRDYYLSPNTDEHARSWPTRWPWLVLILCLVGLALRAWH